MKTEINVVVMSLLKQNNTHMQWLIKEVILCSFSGIILLFGDPSRTSLQTYFTNSCGICCYFHVMLQRHNSADNFDDIVLVWET